MTYIEKVCICICIVLTNLSAWTLGQVNKQSTTRMELVRLGHAQYDTYTGEFKLLSIDEIVKSKKRPAVIPKNEDDLFPLPESEPVRYVIIE